MHWHSLEPPMAVRKGGLLRLLMIGSLSEVDDADRVAVPRQADSSDYGRASISSNPMILSTLLYLLKVPLLRNRSEKMRRSRRRAKSTVAIGNLTFLSKPLLSTRHPKNEFLELYLHTGCQNETVPEEGKIHRSYREFNISLQTVPFNKTSKK